MGHVWGSFATDHEMQDIFYHYWNDTALNAKELPSAMQEQRDGRGNTSGAH